MSIASKITRLFDFVAGTRIKSADVDAELNQLVAQHNNLVDDVNAQTVTAGIADGAVTAAKLAAGAAVGSMSAGEIPTSKLANGAVTADKLDPALLEQGVDLNMHRLAATIDHPDGSVTPAKLSFDPATQTELDGRINAALLTTNVGNAYTTVGSVTGSVVPVKFNADSTGAVTINGKPLLLPGGAAATEVKAGALYNLTTDGTSFFMGSAGLTNFFGDGSDGAFNPATILAAATAPNGGTVANLWDMNTGTTFVASAGAGDAVLLSIDFGTPQSVYSYFFSAVLSTGSRNLKWQFSVDNLTWTDYTSIAVSTSSGDKGGSTGTQPGAYRYWRALLAAGTACTFTCQGLALNYNFITLTDTQTTKVWNIIYPSVLNGPAVVKQFSSLTLPAGYSMTVGNPCQGLIIYCQGNAVINGTIDMSKKAGLAPNGNIIPLPVTKKNGSGAKTLEKYLQLTTVLQALKGGAGGNGGYGGGYNGSTGRQTSVGTGGAGRVNLGGFGGGGSGGAGVGSVSMSGGVGGSISIPEIGGGFLPAIYTYCTGGSIPYVNGSNGSGARGNTYFTANGITLPMASTANGGGGGGFGGGTVGVAPVSPGDGEYAGGLLCLISGGSVSGSGSLISNGGTGGAAGGSGTGTCGGGGGGGGSGGGVIAIYYAASYSFSGTTYVSGGAGGAAGTGASPGESGGAGSSGGVGTIHLQQVS